MITNLNKYIDHLLYTKGSVSLNGIGTITMERSSALISPNKKEILPPKVTFWFKDVEAHPFQLAAVMAESEGIPREVAEAKEKAYSEKLLDHLVNYNIVKVSDIGFLEKKDIGVIFTPSQQSLDQAYYGLPVLQLDPVKKSAPLLFDSAPVPMASYSKDNEYEWLTYLAALLLGAIMILSYHYFVDPFPYETKNSALKQAETKMRVLADERSAEIKEDKELSPSGIDETDPEFGQGEVVEEITSTPPSNGESEDSSEVILAKPSAETECVIIIGVFTRTINALELSDRLREDGYNPYLENINDTQRVGLSFKCADYDLESMIKQVRRKYNKKAWYLVPQISI